MLGKGDAERGRPKSFEVLGGGAGFVGGGDTRLRELVFIFNGTGWAGSGSSSQCWFREIRPPNSGSIGDSSGVRIAPSIFGGVPGLRASGLGRAKLTA